MKEFIKIFGGGGVRNLLLNIAIPKKEGALN